MVHWELEALKPKIEIWLHKASNHVPDVDHMFLNMNKRYRFLVSVLSFSKHEIFRFAKMILRDKCSTSYDLVSLFRGGRNTLETWTGKIAKCNGTRPSALHSTFHY